MGLDIELKQELETFAAHVGEDMQVQIESMGPLASLDTAYKTDLVGAINEIFNLSGGGAWAVTGTTVVTTPTIQGNVSFDGSNTFSGIARFNNSLTYFGTVANYGRLDFFGGGGLLIPFRMIMVVY